MADVVPQTPPVTTEPGLPVRQPLPPTPTTTDPNQPVPDFINQTPPPAAAFAPTPPAAATPAGGSMSSVSRSSSKNLIALIALVALAAAAIGGYWYYRTYLQDSSMADSLNSPQVSATPSPAVDPQTGALIDGGPSAPPAGSQTYTDPEGDFEVTYPETYTQDESGPNGIRIYKQGPSQQGQTEMYDGVIIHLESIDLNGQTLDQWVAQDIQTTTADGTVSLRSEQSTGTYNNYQSIQYTTDGLGSYSNIVIQRDAGSGKALKITSLVADPTGVGFVNEAKQIIDSIKLLK